MKKLLLSATIASGALFMTSCGPGSPEDAAKEICQCMEDNKDDMMGLAGCGLDASKYAQDYKGEELTRFTQASAECAGDMFMGSDTMEEMGEDMEEAMDGISEELEDKVDELQEKIEEKVEGAIDEAMEDLEEEENTEE